MDLWKKAGGSTAGDNRNACVDAGIISTDGEDVAKQGAVRGNS